MLRAILFWRRDTMDFDAINNGGGNGTNDLDVRGVANDDGSAAWLLKICIQI